MGARYALPATTCGVYHLLKDGRVLYVGQSTSVISRVGNWASTIPGEFDAWEFFPCDQTALNDLEREHIKRFDPPMNSAGRTTHYCRASRHHRISPVIAEHGSHSAYLDTLKPLITHE